MPAARQLKPGVQWAAQLTSTRTCTFLNCRLIVGAPTASWLSNASVVSPGAIYRCRIGKNPNRACEQLQLGESGLGPVVSGPHPPLVDSTVAQVLQKLMFSTPHRLLVEGTPFSLAVFYSLSRTAVIRSTLTKL